MFSTSRDVQCIGECHEYIRGGGGGCSVHLEEIMSTLGDIMSTLEDIMSTSGMFSILGGYHDACGGYYEYIRRCSVHQVIS